MYKLRWLQLGRAPDFGKDGKPFMGIGPDGARLTRGSTMDWPYNEDGSMNVVYAQQVKYLISGKVFSARLSNIVREHVAGLTLEFMRTNLEDPPEFNPDVPLEFKPEVVRQEDLIPARRFPIPDRALPLRVYGRCLGDWVGRSQEG